jgi:rubrerythrin
MVQTLTIEEILEKAIEKEIEAQELYRNLYEMMENQAARDILQQLVKVEEKHEALLRRYQRGELGEGALEAGHVLDYRIAEHLEQPEISPGMKLDEVLLLAANREKASYQFYIVLAGAHPMGPVKTLLEDLASQELEHKQKVEYLYNEVAFPQTAGG